MSRNRAGMQPNVARALEDAAEPQRDEIAGCPKCGQRMYFGLDDIGRMVEACTGARGCGHRKKYAGGLTVTKERRLQESGGNKDGEILRRNRAKDSGGKKRS